MKRESIHRPGIRRLWWLLPAVVIVGIAGWFVMRAWQYGSPAQRLGPIGGPSIAQDVSTLVGTPAKAFSFPDADGRAHRVVPGRGRPLVVISHMGFY